MSKYFAVLETQNELFYREICVFRPMFVCLKIKLIIIKIKIIINCNLVVTRWQWLFYM